MCLEVKIIKERIKKELTEFEAKEPGNKNKRV